VTPTKHTKCDETRKAALHRHMRLMYDAKRKMGPGSWADSWPVHGDRPAQPDPSNAWSSDIAYVRLDHGFAYLVAVVDGYSRRVLNLRLSNTPGVGFCMHCLRGQLDHPRQARIVNTAEGWISPGRRSRGLLNAAFAISLDGRGDALGKIFAECLWRSAKCDDVSLKDCAPVDRTADRAQDLHWISWPSKSTLPARDVRTC
jgi:putative transposase